ncbi:hypothetical protein BaRGS_00022146 [Batillaria attramentaria]|uniref:ubiquitinyl hydrolase 1 n=1 Tax=Batillaria attramentaria TaxID=370345 RepID=A0ABD0KI57_9CAEN
MSLSKSFGDSNPEKKRAVEKWVYSNIDYEQIKHGFPICFYRNTSYYLTDLLNLKNCPEDMRRQMLDAVVDRDMQDDLQDARLINWCRNVSSVLPIKVPKDGNCLLHAIATAVWGILDDNLLLRRLLNVALSTDNGGRFYSRWLRNRLGQISQAIGRIPDSNTESTQLEWAEVCGCLDPERTASVAVPHRFLESIHVYTVANILRRPIIILTDSSVRAFSGLSLQDNDMGGVYLPLEWDWADTFRTPVLLAYAHNHFCPLLFADRPQSSSSPSTYRKNLAPLVTGKLEQLPVRLLLEGEEPEVGELLKKYLKVKETVMTLEGSIHSILCAEFETSNLPDDLNVVADFFRDCRQRYQHPSTDLHGLHHAEVAPQPQAPVALQFENFQRTGNQNQSASSPKHARTGQPPRGLADAHHHWPQQSHHYETRQVAAPLVIPPPNMIPQYGSLHSQESSLNPPPSRKCIVPSCKFYGDPTLGMMCSNCFKQYTITESRCMAAALAYERQQPTAPLASIGAQEEEYLPSMMSERCKKGCGYRCSRKTHPYCHECAEKLRREAQEKARAEERSEVTGAGAAAATPAAPMETSSASAPNLVPPSASPAAEQTNAPASRSQILDPFVTPSIPPVSGQAGTNFAQYGDLIQFPSLARKSSEMPAPGSGPTVTMTSPTQVLSNISMSAPLTPPDDTNDMELFGCGRSAAVTSEQPAATTTTHTPSGQNLLGGITNRTPTNNLSEQGRPSASAGQKCIAEGCSEDAVVQNRCSRCYIGMGLNLDPGMTQKLKQMSHRQNSLTSAGGHVNTSPKPIVTQNKAVENLTNPQQGNAMSSFPRPPNSNPPMNASTTYVQSWLQSSGPQGQGQAMGLPERQGGDELGQDLLASGEACHMSGIKCVSPVCTNQVLQPGQLCESCQTILRTAKQGSQAPAGSVQESSSGDRQKCLEENCSFHGAVKTHGYCSEHYRQLFARQLAEETRWAHPANMARTVPLARNQQFVNMTPELRPITAPQGLVGARCAMPGCSYYGDPKQKNMCGKHYQEHISSIASSSNVRVNVPRASPCVQFSHQSATVAKPSSPNVMVTPETGAATVFMQGAVSVPPPSFPIAESGSPGSSFAGQVAVGQSRSLDETYTRVTTKNVRPCMTPGCSNYGNSSKGGLCNSCFENSELVRQTILGEEECG